MAIKKKGDGETPRQYYYRVLNAKKAGDPWARKIRVDAVVYYADNGQIEKARRLIEQKSKKCYGG